MRSLTRAGSMIAIALCLMATACTKPRKEAAEPVAEQASPPPKPVTASRGGVTLPEGVSREVSAAVLKLPTQQTVAVARLVALGDEAEPAMVALLASGNLNEVRGALDYFRQTGRAAGAKGAAALLDHDVPSVRRDAMLTLIAQKAAGQLEAIRGALDDDDAVVRSLAIKALSELGGTEGAKALLPKLSDPDEQVTVEVAAALGKAADTSVAPALLEKVATQGTRPSTMIGALTALRLLKVPVPADTIAIGLGYDDVRAVQAAVRLIPQADPADRRSELLAKALADERPAVRRVAVEEVGVLPEAAALEAVDARLHDDAPEVRAAAVGVLARLVPAKDKVRRLVGFVSDDAPEVRREAYARLGHTTEEAVRPLISRLPHERDRMARELLIRALGLLKDRRALEPLLAVMGDSKEPALWQTGRALGRITGQDFGQDPTAWAEWYTKSTGKEVHMVDDD